jgi:hypothetical protein
VTCRSICRQRPKYANATVEKVLQKVFVYRVCAMFIARQRVAKHIPAETDGRNSRTSIARQRRGKQALSAIQDMFSMDPHRDYISGTESNRIRMKRIETGG